VKQGAWCPDLFDLVEARRAVGLLLELGHQRPRMLPVGVNDADDVDAVGEEARDRVGRKV